MNCLPYLAFTDLKLFFSIVCPGEPLEPAELTVVIQGHLVQPVRGGYVTSRFNLDPRRGRIHRGFHKPRQN